MDRGPVMNSAKPAAADALRRPSTNFAAFAVGLPLSIGLLLLFHKGPLRHSFLFRYIDAPLRASS